MSSPIIRDTEAEGGGGEPVNELGVDPTTDPELYMALQLSLQEERNRQAAQVITTKPVSKTANSIPAIVFSNNPRQKPRPMCRALRLNKPPVSMLLVSIADHYYV